MGLDNEDRPRLPSSVSNNSSLGIIEISSDSEEDVFLQSHPGDKPLKSAIWENDVIELTDSNSSDLPDTLSPLIKGLRTSKKLNLRKQPPLKGFAPLYADTSDDDESDDDYILVLNDPPGSRKPIRKIVPAEAVIRNPPLDCPRRNAVPVSPQAARNSPRKGPAQKAKEQTRRQEFATRLFAELNKEVFGDRLPRNTTLEWSKRLLTTAGRARWHRSRAGEDTTKIELASKILDCDERIRNTLSHEMCHLACWVIDNRPREGHGQLFKSWAHKVMNKYPGIHISTRHNYEISYPYEWECEKCMKIYGRYSKSIRPDECVCGACKVGKLIPLFVERKTMASKTSRLAIELQDSPCPLSINIDNEGVTDLVNALGHISIDHV